MHRSHHHNGPASGRAVVIPAALPRFDQGRALPDHIASDVAAGGRYPGKSRHAAAPPRQPLPENRAGVQAHRIVTPTWASSAGQTPCCCPGLPFACAGLSTSRHLREGADLLGCSQARSGRVACPPAALLRRSRKHLSASRTPGAEAALGAAAGCSGTNRARQHTSHRTGWYCSDKRRALTSPCAKAVLVAQAGECRSDPRSLYLASGGFGSTCDVNRDKRLARHEMMLHKQHIGMGCGQRGDCWPTIAPDGELGKMRVCRHCRMPPGSPGDFMISHQICPKVSGTGGSAWRLFIAA